MQDGLLQTQVHIGKVETLRDRSLKLTVYTQELASDDKSRLFSFAEQNSWMVLAQSKQDEVFVPEEPPTEFKADKSPSQRLRAVMFVYWRDVQGGTGDFDTFYRGQMERIIEKYKRELD